MKNRGMNARSSAGYSEAMTGLSAYFAAISPSGPCGRIAATRLQSSILRSSFALAIFLADALLKAFQWKFLEWPVVLISEQLGPRIYKFW